jgi:tol-pal system protein YbgF
MQKMFVAGLACLVIAAASPAAAQSREQRQMMATLQMLQEQAQQLAISVAALQQALEATNTALNARIDEATNDTRKGFADQRLLIDNISSDVRVVRSSTDDTNVRIASLREELEAVRATVLAMQAPPPVAFPVDPNADPNTVPAPSAGAPSTPGAAPVSPAAPPPPSIAGLSPTRMFETARADYFGAQWSVAIAGFDQFIKAFPRSELADDAQFLIAESQFNQSQWNEAIAAYNQVIQTYPMTNSVPDALYKRGLAQERLGQADAARTSWETVIASYAETDAGRLAKQNLDRLAARRP